MNTYDISAHGEMIADSRRIAAYREAMERVVEPGAVVLDVGTGTGIFALLACRLGARRVHAVEPSGVIQVAKQIADANGFGDRIEFHHTSVEGVSLPEPADVMTSDLRGVLPLFQRHLPALIDARQRLLAPDGVLIPQRDEVWLALVEDAALYDKITGPWEHPPVDFDLTPGRSLVTNLWRKVRGRPEQLLCAPQRWLKLDYGEVTDASASAEVTCTVSRLGTAHGLLAWFDSTLVEGVSLSNSPSEPELLYGSAFFPWPQPVPVAPGDTVAVALSADLVISDYVWSWKSMVKGSADQVRFDQSSFFGSPLTLDRLRLHDAEYAPQLGLDGRIARFVMSRMDGTKDLAELADALVEEFTEELGNRAAALDRVARLAIEYGE